MFSIKLEDGKYEVQFDNDGRLHALRYGQPWRNLAGDNLVLALCQRVQELEERLKAAAPEVGF